MMSKHGVDQVSARVGLPKKAVKRHLEQVLEKGARLCIGSWADWARNHYRADIFYITKTELEFVTTPFARKPTALDVGGMANIDTID